MNVAVSIASTIERTVRRGFDGLIEVVYPRRCSGCGLRGVWVCDACLEALPLFSTPVCHRCGIPVDKRCRCAYVPDDIARLRSAGPYDGWLRQGIHRTKYEGESARSQHLSELLKPWLSAFRGTEALVAVPLHANRLSERGFNQSELLATHLAAVSGIPVWPALIRKRDTLHQVDLTPDEREVNVRGAFAARDETSMRPSSVILIDDVFTTGSTMAECARTLHERGVTTVNALTIC